LDATLEREVLLRKRLKTSRTIVNRLRKKVKSLKEVIEALKKNSLISSNCEALLEASLNGIPLEVMKRITKQKSSKLSRKSYPAELKAFAMTLSFYSLKAYNYVRQTFDLALPHPSTIRYWYKGVAAHPGFTEESFAALSLRVKESSDEKPIICSLMLDEMAIRKQIEFDGSKFVGFVDVGTEIEDDSSPVASEALVLMAVSLNDSWKIPLGYFFITGLTGEERANIIIQCLLKLNDVGVKVYSTTCDGPSCNFSMMNALGAKLDPYNLQAWFPHPADSSVKVGVILDACHMLKLLRNCLDNYQILRDGKLRQIKWSYIEELDKLQEKEGLRLANKLRSAHIQWSKQKMKVNLAAQTLSSSVANAIEFCNENLKLNEFRDCEGTVEFLRLMDKLFDILNSRNPLGKGYKAPLQSANWEFAKGFLLEAKEYIVGLTDNQGNPMVKSKRKTPFVGLLCTVDTVMALCETLVLQDESPLKYLLTYKFSQDHLELFFGALRSSCGSNNNPTVRQFISAYKRLLMRHNVKGGLGNCRVLDETKMLSIAPDSIQSNEDINCDSYDMTLARYYDLEERAPSQVDHDYVDLPNEITLSEYKQAVIAYIAGYVIRMARKKLSCLVCIEALTTEESYIDETTGEIDIGTEFVLKKDRGGLVKASPSVVEVCKETEKCFIRMANTLLDKLPRRKFMPTVCSLVLKTVGSKAFKSLNDHMFATTADNNHIFKLIKCLAECYSIIRAHHMARQNTDVITGLKVRKELYKLVLFKGQ
jgi:DNA transposase THAP9